MANVSAFSGGGFGRELSPGGRAGGRYVLKRLLGRGALTEVWLAHDVQADSDVALKFLPAALFADDVLVKHLREEVHRNALMLHPHVVTTYDFVRDNHVTAIAVEFVHGWSLESLKVDKPQQRYRVDEIEWWIRQLCVALDYAHSEFGIIHRDLKPANLLVTGHDDLKVADFGIGESVRSAGTRHGLVKGVYSGVGFMSPQQVRGETPSRLDDVYSLGATIFDLLTGTPPFYKGEIVAQICGLDPPSMRERLAELGVKDEEIPPVWEKTVAACLARNPAERPQSVVEVQQMLDWFDLTETGAAPARTEALAQPGELASPVELATANPARAGTAESAPADSKVASSRPAWSSKTLQILATWVTAAAVITLVALLVVFKPHSGKAGSVDPTFNVGSGADDEIRCLASQVDGKILAGGRFTFWNGVATRRIVRLDSNGRPDPAFASHPLGAVQAVAVQSDGKILIGGESLVTDRPHRRVMRLNPGGSVDENFGSKVGYNQEVRSLLVQPDGKVLVSGSFSRADNKRSGRIVRLDSDGGLDGSFHLGEGASAPVWALAEQADGKILAGGSFDHFDNRDVGHIVRLNSDGGLDDSFGVGKGANGDVLAIVVQRDGRILIGGDFLRVNDAAHAHIARLNPDGSLDASFKPSPALNGAVRSIALQADGKIIIGGSFDRMGTATCPGIARLNADGSLDSEFDVGQGASGSVWCVALQPDGKILAAGRFTNFGGVAVGRIVRLEQ